MNEQDPAARRAAMEEWLTELEKFTADLAKRTGGAHCWSETLGEIAARYGDIMEPAHRRRFEALDRRIALAPSDDDDEEPVDPRPPEIQEELWPTASP